MSKVHSPTNILIVRLDRIGDVLLSTPAIKAIKDAFPNSRLSFMVKPYAREVVEGNPYLEDVIIYDKEGTEKSLSGNMKFALMLRRRKFDMAIILHPMTRAHLVTFLAGIPIRFGYNRKAGFFLTRKIPHTKQYGLRHEIDYVLDMLGYIGIRSDDRSLYMPADKTSEERVRKIFAENGVKDGDTIVAIGPGASCVSKRWPKERFAEVGEGLMKRFGAKIVILAGPEDKDHGNGVARLIRQGCINLSGKTRVSDAASVLRRAVLFISNDSGLVHIASAVETPSVVIFGRSDTGLSPLRWGPSGKEDIVLHKDVDCDVCLAHRCQTGFKCLYAVSAGEVIKAAETIISRRGGV